MDGKYALFTGCFIPAEMPYLEKTAVELLKNLGVNIHFLEFSCCPNTRIKSVDEMSWLNLAARNLALAEKNNLDILSLCMDCYGTLKKAVSLLEDESVREEVNSNLEKIGLEYNGKVKVEHIIDLLFENREKIADRITFPLDLSLALHDGCNMRRPSDIVDYNPNELDELSKLIGCTVVGYPSRDFCCGSPASTVKQEFSDNITKLKLDEINGLGVDAVCTGCPLCFMQYDSIQNMPVFYYPELLAIALGIHPREAGIQFHRTDGSAIIEKALSKNV